MDLCNQWCLLDRQLVCLYGFMIFLSSYIFDFTQIFILLETLLCVSVSLYLLMSLPS